MTTITHDNQYEDFNDIQNELNAMIPLEDCIVDSWSQYQIDAVNSSKSKKIRRFPSGAVRSDDTGRIRPDYLSPYALSEIAEHFTIAKNDFGPTNYFKGIKPEEVLPSVMRHMLEIQEGLMIGNADMVRNGFRSLGANSIMALHQIVLEEKGLYKEPYGKTELVDIEYAKANQDTD